MGVREILVLGIVAAALAMLFAYAGGARAAKSGKPSPVSIGAGPLSRDDFWALVDHSAIWRTDADAQMADLRASLNRLTPAQIVAFQGYFDEAMIGAYRWDLWGAAYVAKGGASDDGFEYFRSWLIAQGHSAYVKVLADPDGLAELAIPDADDDLEFESFAYVAGEVWSAKTGQAVTRMPGADGRSYPSQPVGEPFREDSAELAKRYPGLWKRFGSWF
ncbi:hypothetical protein QE379_001511 [Sphingomonas sp. SORGH_AS 879]|nr:hypothetical protein [Sphingomonas sp. SORGH_AS_0879]